MVYECPRCKYFSTQKGDMRKHFKRKKLCSAIASDKSIEECVLEVLGGDFQKVNESKCFSGKMVNESKCFSGKSKCFSEKSKCFECRYCGKSFNQKQGRYQHENKFCKLRETFTKEEVEEVVAEKIADKDKVIDDKDKIIDELKKQIEVLLTKVGDTHIQNNTYNIVLNAFGKENTSYIEGGFVKNLIKQGPYSSIPKLIKAIHFDPEHKENHNIKIPNKKQSLAKIYNGDRWEYKNKKETIDDLTDKAYNLLEDHYEGGNKHMNKFIGDFDSDSKTVKKIHTETEVMILNNQD